MDNRNYWGNGYDLSRRGESFLLDHVPISGRLVPGKRIGEDYPRYRPLVKWSLLSLASKATELADLQAQPRCPIHRKETFYQHNLGLGKEDGSEGGKIIIFSCQG